MLDGNEVFFDDNELIVSKTDLKGHITYANDIFLNISGFKADEVMGKPHNVIRHDFMPHSIFHLLWQTLENKKEIFAYVVNKTKTGGHYWVLAHVTPSLNQQGEILGYHSSRRVPERTILENTIIPLYKELNRIESGPDRKKAGTKKALDHLNKTVKAHSSDYHEFILTLDRLAA